MTDTWTKEGDGSGLAGRVHCRTGEFTCVSIDLTDHGVLFVDEHLFVRLVPHTHVYEVLFFDQPAPVDDALPRGHEGSE